MAYWSVPVIRHVRMRFGMRCGCASADVIETAARMTGDLDRNAVHIQSWREYRTRNGQLDSVEHRDSLSIHVLILRIYRQSVPQ